MSTAPAQILAIEAGSLKEGMPADITIIDPHREWIVDSNSFYTRGKLTPFESKKMKGRAVATIVGGKFVMQNSEVIV